MYMAGWWFMFIVNEAEGAEYVSWCLVFTCFLFGMGL